MNAIKKRFVTGNNKTLKTYDLIDPVTNLLYHGEFKMQILKEEFDKVNTIIERRINHGIYGFRLSSYEVSI